jgi:hypothetical protein
METIQSKLDIQSILQKLDEKQNEPVDMVITTNEGESFYFSAKLDIMFGRKATEELESRYLIVEIIGDGTYTQNVE